MKNRMTLFYVGFVGGFTLLGLLLLKLGGSMDKTAVAAASAGTPLQAFLAGILHHLHSPLGLLLVQVMVVLVVARALGALALKLGQPSVVGEMIAGIALGPSLMGMLFPQVKEALFPPASLGNLQLLAQLGLVLFMFIIGIELDLGLIKKKAGAAVVISHASIVFPFFLGITLSLALYRPFAPEKVGFLSFALFMGIAMSITAFPVLARIIQERNMTRTVTGTIALTCAAADDVTAWCLLAAVVAVVQAGSMTSALFTLLLTVLYLVVMLKLVAPFLSRLSTLYPTAETLGKPVMAMIFLVLLLSAWSTEIIGIHALFGAFLAGAIMPQDHNFRRVLTERIEDVAMVLLLPLFFVFTGLRTQLGLLSSPKLWLICLGVIAVAVAGKLLGSSIAARFMGMSWKDSLVIGVLMNTRGLMELVVLNIGYDLGVLSAEVFTMMVMMALGTTMMTGPVLNGLDRVFRHHSDQPLGGEQSRILISFGPPRKGSLLLGLARRLGQTSEPMPVTALHLTPSSEVNPLQAEEFERTAFAAVNETAQGLGVTVSTMYRVTSEVEETIRDEANSGAYEILLVGAGKTLFSDDELGGVIRKLLEQVEPHLGVLLDRGSEGADHVFFPMLNERDLELRPLLYRLLQNGTQKVSVMDPNGVWSLEPDPWGGKVVKVDAGQVGAEFWSQVDLVVVSLQRWTVLKATQSAWMDHLPSVLIFRQGTRALSLAAPARKEV